MDGREIEFMAGTFEHFQLLDGHDVVVGIEGVAQCGIGEARNIFRGAISSAGGALEEVNVFLLDIVDAFERRTIAERPSDGNGGESEDFFEFVEEGDGIQRGTVALVHERENRHAAAATDFEQLAGLRLDAFGGVDDHKRGIDGGEHAVGVFRKVFVTGGIEQVDRVAVKLELEHGGRDGDTALALERHPVGRGGALVLAGGDGAREVHGVAVEKKLLRQRGFTRIGMRDDGKGAAAGDFLGW